MAYDADWASATAAEGKDKDTLYMLPRETHIRSAHHLYFKSAAQTKMKNRNKKWRS